jgi:phosphoenolpyruvate synthase/pyruvate phosphate dikinase
MEAIVSLSDAADIRLVGGKAASLNKLIKNSFKVPPGFVVTRPADDESHQNQVLDAFDKLGAEKVAVRSSAVAEDGGKDAWAGQLDTFLDVYRSALLEKIKLCFSSAGSKRAMSYARQKGIDAGSVAVIVQKMVPSEISGVAFSVHPVTNNPNKMVIESTRGLGEKLVSGLITPDTYVLDKSSGKADEKHVQAEPTLSDEQLTALSGAVREIETVFGFPVDVEWALLNKELFILQSRPITTLG